MKIPRHKRDGDCPGRSRVGESGEALQSSEADITVKKQALASAQETLQSLQAVKDQKDTALSQAQNDFQQAQTEIEDPE